MRDYIAHRGDFYTVYRSRCGGLEIVRKADGAAAFFQGDDGATLADDLDSCEGLIIGIDFTCSEYDHILECPPKE